MKRFKWIVLAIIVPIVQVYAAGNRAPLRQESPFSAYSSRVSQWWGDFQDSRIAQDWVFANDSFLVRGYEAVESKTAGRVSVGVDFKHYILSDSRRSTGDHFLGSIDQMNEEQGYDPLPFVRYTPNPYWSVGFGYDRLYVETWSRPDLEGELGHTDGTIHLSGYSLSVKGHYPNRSRFTPFAEAGVIFYKAKFDHADAWRNSRGDIDSHILDLDDRNGYRIGVGCDINVYKRVDIVVSMDKTVVEVDSTYYLYGVVRAEETFPLDHASYRIGLQCRF